MIKSRSITLFIILSMISCAEKEQLIWKSIMVKASAYNSVKSQTDAQPNIAAWGDSLVPGMKCIAVSRDLIALGLKHNTKVKIEGLEGIYEVKDKMHARWKNRIDIYMGKNVQKAKAWGIKKLKIQYAIEIDSLNAISR